MSRIKAVDVEHADDLNCADDLSKISEQDLRELIPGCQQGTFNNETGQSRSVYKYLDGCFDLYENEEFLRREENVDKIVIFLNEIF